MRRQGTGAPQRRGGEDRDIGESNTEQPENDEIVLSNDPEIIYVITAGTANIRSGPSTDFEVIAGATRGEVYSGTGNEETAENSRVWYEIYLDAEKMQTKTECYVLTSILGFDTILHAR